MSSTRLPPSTAAPRDDLLSRHAGTSTDSGYRNAPVGPARRTEACACGTDITAETGWEAVRIDEHAVTPQHRAWAKWLAETWQ